MESQSLAKLSVSKLKALALYKGVSIKGCLEKDEIISALRAGGVKDGESAPAAPPAAAPAAAPPSKPVTAATSAAAAASGETASDDGDWAFTDPLLDGPRRSKFQRIWTPSMAQAKASTAPAPEAGADTERKGLKFFQLRKGQRDVVAKGFAERKLPPPPVVSTPVSPAAPLLFGLGGAKVVEARKAGVELLGLPMDTLKTLAKDHDVKLDGCLEKEDVVAALVAKGITDNKPRPKIIAPPPKKAGGAPPPMTSYEPMTPQEYYAKKNKEVNDKWQRTVETYNRFKPKFFQGAMWQIFSGFPLWAHEDTEDRTGFMYASNQIGNPTVIEICAVGKNRLRVRATRWNSMTSSMMGSEPSGWMDVSMVVEEDGAKLSMRPYDPQGMYVQTATGQEPVLMTRRTCLQEKLRVHPEHGAGLHLTGTPAGMQVDDIDPLPGQPGLAVGDLIVGIGGINLVGLPGKMDVEMAFRERFIDGAELEIAA